MVSIIMPAFNAARFLEEAIQSVLDQTYRDWELLVIDDGSADQTAQIAEAFSREDARIRLIKNEYNMGVAETRNRGVALAAGEWIAFLDSDDCWHPEKLEKQLAFARENGAEFVFSGSAFMNEQSERLDYYLSVPRTISYKELLKQNRISCSSVLIRRELIAAYPMKHAADMHEDFAVWLKILRGRDIRAFGVDEPLLIYRVRAASKSGNKIKAGLMTFRVYRYLGIPLCPAWYYWCCYLVRNVKKYRRLNAGARTRTKTNRME